MRLAPGVRYTVIRDERGPFRIRIVSAKLTSTTTFDTVLATDRLPGFETTSSMAERTEALVAINGDYARPSGRPVFTFASDGYIAETPLLWGRNFAVDRSETTAFIGHPKVKGWATETDSGTIYPIKRVNAGPAESNQLARFTPAGGSEEKPPTGSCQARLQPQEGARFASTRPGVETNHLVETVHCGGRSLRPQGGSVLAAPVDGDYALGLAGLLPGESMTLGWSLGWPEVLDTIGGNPTLVEDGAIVEHNVTGDGAFFKRHPRTGVGTTPDGRILLVVVDGRQPDYSVGMNLREFAKLFVSLGADQALNLDGGGSTTMVINGEIVNRPSSDDGEERPGVVGSRSPPRHGPRRVRVRTTGRGSKAGHGVGRDSDDPASTGGLADVLRDLRFSSGPSD